MSWYKTSTVTSIPHVATTGIKQCDPLSGILFIMTIYVFIRIIQRVRSWRNKSNRKILHYVLAYADEKVNHGEWSWNSRSSSASFWNIASEIGILFNSRKSISIHYSKSCLLNVGMMLLTLMVVKSPVYMTVVFPYFSKSILVLSSAEHNCLY